MLRKKSKRHFYIVTVIVVLLVIWTAWSNTTVGITHYTVASDKLPASFDHYSIVVVSDLHNAEFGENNSQLIKLIEKEKPDIIVITGDLVDSNKTNIDIAQKLVGTLTGIAPCYYVTGNHEAWLGEQYQELESILLDEGVAILHDRAVQLIKNTESIQLAGLDDPDFTGRAPLQQSMIKTKINNMNLTDNYCVLLSHRPEAFEDYVSENIDLVLSGHAHGGQFRLPIIGGIVAPNQGLFPKYDAGIYSENYTTMVVSIRMCCPAFPTFASRCPPAAEKPSSPAAPSGLCLTHCRLPRLRRWCGWCRPTQF